VRFDEHGVEIEGPTQLAGGFTANMHEMSDQALTVAAMAVFADAPVSITGVEHIRAHESDRIRAICANLSRLGIEVQEKRDGLTVRPGTVRPSLLDPQDDHRVAMSLSLLGARVPGIRVRNPACVSKTFPEFYSRLRELGIGVHFAPG
jgi:3-phosphoshikimate 1-carboxyvinyltransferase